MMPESPANINMSIPAKKGRNAPCPCGSRKKYKAFCMQKSQQVQAGKRLSSQFHFESGSYGDIGHFMPSIACLKQLAVDTAGGLIENVWWQE